MTTATIKKGKTESEVITLAHLKISSIKLPSCTPQNIVFLYGGYDGTDLCPVDIFSVGRVEFILNEFKRFMCLNAEASEGIMYYKFVINTPVDKDLEFNMWHQDD